MQVGPQSQAYIAQAIGYLIKGVSVEIKEKQRLMIGVNYKSVSEPREQLVKIISQCQG